MKPRIEPTLTKNDPCANKGQKSTINANALSTQDHYILFVNESQEKYKRVINNTQFNELADNLGMTQEQRQNFIRLALAYQAKP